MTIKINRPEVISHEENMFYQVCCHNCPRISEESGDYLPGHMEIAGIHEHINYEKAISLAEEHDLDYKDTHLVVVDGIDSEMFRGLL